MPPLRRWCAIFRPCAVLAIEGVESVTNTAKGKLLVTDIGGATARRLRLQAGTNRDPFGAGLKR